MTFFIKIYYSHSIHIAQSKNSLHLKKRILAYLRVERHSFQIKMETELVYKFMALCTAGLNLKNKSK